MRRFRDHLHDLMRCLMALLLTYVFVQPIPATPEVLEFWSAFGTGEPKVVLTRFVDEFNRAHSELGRIQKLDMEYAQLEQKLLTTVAGKVPPGLVLFNRPNAAAYALRGAFEPWDEYLAELGVRADQFYPYLWSEGIWDGKQYCLPFNTDVRVLFYNKRLFREAGLDPERPPRTWDELRAMSRQLTKRTPQGRLLQTGFVPLGGLFGNTFFPLFAYQMGDDLLEDGHPRVNRPAAVAAMRWIVDFCDEYNTPDLMLLQSAGGTDALSLFLTERMAMTGDEGYLLSLIRKHRPDLDFGVAPLPIAPNGQPTTWSGGFGFVLPRGQRLTPLGREFVKYLLSIEVQINYARQSAQIPARIDAATAPELNISPINRVFTEALTYSRSLPVSPLCLKLFTEMVRATEQATYHRVTPEQALNGVQQVLDAEWNDLSIERRATPIPWVRVMGGIGLVLVGLVFWRAARAILQIRHLRLGRSQAVWGYLFALPAIIGLLGLALGPMLMSLFISFTNYDILNPPRLIGLKNFARMFTGDPLFLKSLWNTLYFTAFSVPLGIALSLGLALLLNSRLWLRSLWRAVFFLPSIFPIVAGTFLWLWLFNGEFGVINAILQGAGLPVVPWLTSPHWAKPALILMSLWGIGGSMIIFLAALQGVPETLYEAGRIDGAGAWRRFWNITLPMISPAVFFVFVMSIIGSFQVFTQAYLTTKGGPLDSTTFYMLYLFREGFEYFHMGYASAMAWVLVLIVGGLVLVQFRLSRRLVNYDSV